MEPRTQRGEGYSNVEVRTRLLSARLHFVRASKRIRVARRAE